MSNATLERSRSNISIIAAASRVEMSCNASASTACMASQNLRWSSTFALILVNRSPAVVAHQSAKAFFDRGATSRPSAANARYVPTEAPASERRAPTTSSMTPATSRSVSSDHTAATSPKRRCRVRSGTIPASAPSIAATMSAAEPRYRSETIFGLPSTRAISRR